jgi:hypothetical protein
VKARLYLVQGIIFQQGHTFGLGNKPGIGTAVTIQNAMHFALCNGIMGSDEETPDLYGGVLNDRWGDSDISEGSLTETELKFTKRYKNRSPIYYVFNKKVENVWYGTYSGKDSGTGSSKIILTEINSSFLEPEK